MGSILTGTSSLPLKVDVADADAGDGFSKIDLIDSAKQIIATQDCASNTMCSMSAKVDVPVSMYVIARATQADGNTLIAAPIWVAP